MTAAVFEPKLLVPATLEALLAKSTGRRDQAARVERIKAAALMECAEKGYPALTIAGVAKRAKVSTASIYAEYADRDSLLVSAMEMLFNILVNDVIELPDIEDPVRRVEALLIAHGHVYDQPLAVWFFRLHAMLSWSGHHHLRDIGRRVFQGIDAFWATFLQGLVDAGHLRPLDMRIAVPLLLGPVERCTIISRLACGDEDSGRPELKEVARYSAESLFAVCGRLQQRDGQQTFMSSATAALAGAEQYEQSESCGEGEPAPTHEDGDTAPAHEGETAEPMTPAQRKALILRAAAAECQERGYNAASVLEVAARAGVSIATLYKHFKDKHTLFSRAVEEAIKGRLPLDLKEAVGVEAHAYAGAAIFAVADVMSHPKNAWIANIMMASEISDTARIRALARREREEIETAIERIVLGWRADGLVIAGDTALATNLLLGAVERAGLLALIVFGPGAVDRRDLAVLADQAARLLLAFLKCEQRT